MENTPVISVLLPVYNAAPYLRSAVRSILAQSFTNFELVAINDGSTDNSLEILNEFMDPRLRVINNPHNVGISASLNNGLATSRGQYIARMDADDISMPARLASQLHYFERHPGVGILGTGFETFTDENRTGKFLSQPCEHEVITWSLCFYSPLVHPSVMMRKSVLEALNGYSTDCGSHDEKFIPEDYELWWRASHMTRFANLPDILLRLRKHEKNATTLYLSDHIRGSTVIGERFMSEMLGQEIPFQLVLEIRSGEYSSSEMARSGIDCLQRLYARCIQDPSLTLSGKQEVTQDVIRRMLAVSAPGFNILSSGDVLPWCWRLNPAQTLQLGFRRLGSILKRRVNSLASHSTG